MRDWFTKTPLHPSLCFGAGPAKRSREIVDENGDVRPADGNYYTAGKQGERLSALLQRHWVRFASRRVLLLPVCSLSGALFGSSSQHNVRAPKVGLGFSAVGKRPSSVDGILYKFFFPGVWKGAVGVDRALPSLDTDSVGGNTPPAGTFPPYTVNAFFFFRPSKEEIHKKKVGERASRPAALARDQGRYNIVFFDKGCGCWRKGGAN